MNKSSLVIHLDARPIGSSTKGLLAWESLSMSSLRTNPRLIKGKKTLGVNATSHQKISLEI